MRMRWPEGATRRLLLALVTSGCLFLASWARLLPQKVDYVEGDTAVETIYAPRSGVYIDPEKTEQDREDAANSVPDVYDADPTATHDVLTAVDDIFDRFKEVRENPDLLDALSRVKALGELLDISLSTETRELAISESTPDTALDRVRDGVGDLVRREMAKGLRSNYPDDLRKAREDLTDNARALGYTSAFTAMAAEIGRAVLKNNRIYNDEKTKKAQEEKRDSVKEVTHQIRVDDPIIFAGEEVGPRHIAMFQAVGLMQVSIDYSQAAGTLFVFTLMVLLLGVYAMSVVPESYEDFGQLVTIAVFLVVVGFAYRTIEPTSWFEAGALTLAVTVSMTVALLMNVLLASATGVFLAVLLPVVAAGNDARLVLVTVVCTLGGVFVVSRKGSKSSVIARAAPLMALLAAVTMLAGSEVFGMTLSFLRLRMVVIAAIGGFASPLLAMGASVALERLLGMTTDFRLMELGNSNEPVLQRLIAEAPGSYQSSVMVGNLAEPAAEAIGANGLLVRTAALYHDIGKIRRPYFFVENQFGGDNPHDRLSPHLSALVIISHVKDGVELAEEYGLPTAVRNFIPEHHGTTMVQYFYAAARELADDPQDVQASNFRYPGPKPQSRETAVLMLADTVEAAARTLENPSQQEVQDLVDRLVDERVKDGQLDESPISFKDVAAVKRSFVSTLGSMFHQRVKYPDQIIREAQKAEQEAHEAETQPAPTRASADSEDDAPGEDAGPEATE